MPCEASLGAVLSLLSMQVCVVETVWLGCGLIGASGCFGDVSLALATLPSFSFPLGGTEGRGSRTG